MATSIWMAAFRGAAVALLLAAVPAMAQNDDSQGDNNNQGNNNQGNNNQGNNNQGNTRSAPEFDPAVAGVVGTLVAGGGLLLARRRRR